MIDALATELRRLGRVVVAYSGGVDSAFLADVAHEVLGPGAQAVTAVSASLAPREREAARALAAERGWSHAEIETDELERPEYRANRGDRCFHCKDALFDVLDVLAGRDQGVVCVGTNLDDLSDVRPGLRAVAEHGVAQPLVVAGFSKAAVREAAAARGLRVADKPATPCLASRVAIGVEVTAGRLGRIARAEELLWALGVRDVRVRDHGDRARIEVPLDDLPLVRGAFPELEPAIRRLGFREVELDPRGLRSGSMNALPMAGENAFPAPGVG